MARNSRWESQRYDNQDNPDSIRYARYENESPPRNVYYDKQPQRQTQRDIEESDYRDKRYNRLNDNMTQSQSQPQQYRQNHEYSQRQTRHDQDEEDYRQTRYNRYNQERPIQDYPLPLTLPVPLAVPPALEYEPM